MKRKALLIGNTSGLPGVQVDIIRFASFLKSNGGGAWYDSEIETFQNEKKNILLQKIDALKKQSFDYVVVLFSGHGGQQRQTILEINEEGETIEETRLRQIAVRQMNIYDCCRAFPALNKGVVESRIFKLSEDAINPFRQKYENRIMQSIPQQALLYSCSIGQYSYDTSDGGVYLGNLLKAARNFHGEDFKLVGKAHEEAISPTMEYSERAKLGIQTPDAIIPKCLSSQQMIISMNV